MHSWHRQTGDQHREAPEKEDGATDGKASSGNDEPVLVEDDHYQPDGEERHPRYFCHLKGPGNVRNIVQDNVWQWRIFVHVRNPVMDNRHHKGRQP